MATQTTALQRAIRSVVKTDHLEATDSDLLVRFVAKGDQGAFATLVGRHCGMVMGVCRRIVVNQQDAEDATQATFLILARKAKTNVRWQESLANYLYTTARNVAQNARVAAQRRARYEARAAVREVVEPVDCLTGRELLALLDRELDKLPPRYREPLLLCYLEGLTRDEAAIRLGISTSALKVRIHRGRNRLHEALTKSGWALGAGLLAFAATSPARASSPRLVQSILASALGSPPRAVAELAKGVAVNGVIHKVCWALVAAVGVVALGIGLESLTSLDAGQPPDKPVPVASDKPPVRDVKPAPESPQEITVSGRVLDPDDKPVAGAEVAWRAPGKKEGNAPTTTGADGRFRLTFKKADPSERVTVVATAKDHGPDWVDLENADKGGEITLRLPADDAPFTGRIASLENQPLKDVTVEVVRLLKGGKGNPMPKAKIPGISVDFMEMLRQLKNVELDRAKQLLSDLQFRQDSDRLDETGLSAVAGEFVLGKTETTTDADGKFRLTGLGRDRVLALRVHGPNVEMKFLWGATRTVEPKEGDTRTKLYLPDSTLLLAPSRPLVGTVHDAKTGKPVVGAAVLELGSNVPNSVTDEQGRYRIEGVKMKEAYNLIITAGPGLPYFDGLEQRVVDTPGLGAVETRLKLDRGLELTGRVIDKATGRPVVAEVQYLPLEDNPNVKDLELSRIRVSSGRTDQDGRFSLTVWPGQGVIDVRADDGERYAAVNAEKVLSQLGVRRRLPGVVNALLPIDADEAKPGSLTATISLDEAPVRKGSVVDSDGKPLTGVTAAGLKKKGVESVLTAPDFTVVGVNADSHHLLLFLHEEKKLGALQPVSGTGTDPVVVKLQPLATFAGLVRKGDKEPWAGLTVTALPRVPDGHKYENLPIEKLKIQGLFYRALAPWWNVTRRVATTDDEGRFRLDGLVPGLEYILYVADGDVEEPDTLVTSRQKVTITAGQTLDLGVLKKGDSR